jgi:hypothetical protein
MATADDARRLALSLPETSERPMYGTPAFYVRRKHFARLRDGGETIVVRCDMGERELLLGAEPDTFFVTDHYRDWPYVLVRLAEIEETELLEVLTDSWLMAAPKRLAATLEP